MGNKCTYTALKKTDTIQSQPYEEHRLNLALKSLSCEEVYPLERLVLKVLFLLK